VTNLSIHWSYKDAELQSNTRQDRGQYCMLLLRDEETIKINIPFFLLPPESKEDDILDITIARDVQETEDAKERVSSLLEKLKKKNIEAKSLSEKSVMHIVKLQSVYNIGILSGFAYCVLKQL
jgi:hypothetical protein